MDLQRPSVVRYAFAALVVLALTLAGVGRGLAVASDIAPPFTTLAGVLTPICHAGGEQSKPSDPGRPVQHDCCDDCALCAPAVLPGPPNLPVRMPVARELARSAVATWTARLSRARSPRQSQGPPAA